MEAPAASGRIEVPSDRLSQEALHGLVDEFITREGTDYGEVEFSLEAKRAQVLAQIRRGEVLILFELETEAVTLVTRRELASLSREP